MAGSLLPQPKQLFQDANWNPLVGGRIFTYAAGTLTPKTTYQDVALTAANTNPTIVNARGEALMYGTGAYRVILKDPGGATLYDVDNIESTRSISEAVAAEFAATLSAASGSSRVGFRQFGTNASDRNSQEKMREWFSILDYGGDPSAADNTAALSRARADGVRALRFPLVGTNGTYTFGGALPPDLTEGMTLDVAPGATLRVLDIPYIHPSARFSRETPLACSAFQNTFSAGPTINRAQSGRLASPAYADLDSGSQVPVICNQDLQFKKVTFGGDTFGSFVPAATSVSGVTISTTDSNDYLAAFARVIPGEEISAQFLGAVGDVSLLALVRTATSYYGIVVGTSDTAQPTEFAKAASLPVSASLFTYYGMGTLASCSGYKSLWGIRINSMTSFSIMFNGSEVRQVTTNDEIIEAGLGVQGGAGGSITIQDWVRYRGRKQLGKKPQVIAFFSDSNGDGAILGNVPDQLMSTLDSLHGIRCMRIDNYAHSGDNSAAQLALCTPAAVAKVDGGVIILGLNDQQGGVLEATYESNLRTMIGRFQSANKWVVVGMHSMYYERGQSGGRGQATTNYDRGRGLRAKCARVCAELNVKMVDLPGVMGPVLPEFINPALSTDPGLLLRDPGVFDNIHWTLLTRWTIANAVANAIVGQLTPVPTLKTTSTALRAANLAGGWTFTSQPGRWIRDETGVVTLSGLVDRGAAIADGTVIYTLPENLRPSRTCRLVAWCDAGIGRLLIDAATGQMSIYGFPVGGTWLSLDGMAFATK